ncbi:dienelactone hydrolase [Devosia sp.]|uniref:alpha/beta hydrolase family protein n=1 Tax=Devosia sp. TaxID=1871048 RepID=UPI003265E4C5
MKTLLAVLIWSALSGLAMAQSNRIDELRPDAPALAAHGEFAIGVRTITVTHYNQANVLNGSDPLYERPLTLEVWYPAEPARIAPATDYADVTLIGGTVRYTLHGSAVRDATPLPVAKPAPLVILSHGYPGNRFLISHFGEHLASRGYVVAAIDHFESTYHNQLGFASTLMNRPLDQLFVLSEIDRLSKTPGQFLHGIVDASNTAVIGYSMGGYGAIISAGGGVTQASTELPFAPANGALQKLQAGTKAYKALLDPRLKAIVAIGPWGRQMGFWDADGLAGIAIPALFMAGSLDEVSGYAEGTRKIFEETVNSDRYLLTFDNAGHNAAAPIPAPAEAYIPDAQGKTGFEHYADFVWDNVRMNNIADHFVTAFLDLHLRGDSAKRAYLDMTFSDDYSEQNWNGFGPRTARGLKLEHAAP